MNRFQTFMSERVLGIKASSLGAPLVIPSQMSGRPLERPWTRDQFLQIAATGCETAANCMVFRADGVSKAPFGAFRDGEFDPTHELSALFSHPNLQYSQSDFFHQIMYTLLGDGAGVFVIAPLNNAGVPCELWVRNSRQVRPIPDSDTFIKGWQLRVDNNWKDIDPDKYLVWQHRFVPLDVSDLFGSWPPLLRAARAVKSFSYLGAWLESLLKNRAIIDGFITTKGDIPLDNIDAIESRLNSKLAGAGNAGGYPFLPGNLDVIQTGQKLSDIDPGEVEDRLETKICGSFQLNPVSARTHAGINVSGGLGGDKISSLIAQDYQGTVMSDWNLLKADIGIALAERFGLTPADVGFDLSGISELSEDQDARYNRAKGAQFLSPNRALELVGEDAIDPKMLTDAGLPASLADLPMVLLTPQMLATALGVPEPSPAPFKGAEGVVLPFVPKARGL